MPEYSRTIGFKELSKQLNRMAEVGKSKAIASAARSSMLPAKKEAQANAPVGTPPYDYEGRQVDPYPKRTYKGKLTAPGFARRQVAIRSKTDKGKGLVRVMLGVLSEAFYAVQFIELGTSKIPKRPWLEPSFKRSLPEVDNRFKKRLKELIDKAAK